MSRARTVQAVGSKHVVAIVEPKVKLTFQNEAIRQRHAVIVARQPTGAPDRQQRQSKDRKPPNQPEGCASDAEKPYFHCGVSGLK